MTLLNTLRNHDWYFAYSDDHAVWNRGRVRGLELKNRIKNLDCPYTMTQLRQAVHNMVLEDFVEEEPGKWFRHPRKYTHIAPTRREELLSKKEHEQIMDWIKNQD